VSYDTCTQHQYRLFPTKHFHAFLKYTTVGRRDIQYYHEYLETLDEGQSPLPDMKVQEMFVIGNYCADGVLSGGHAERLLVDTRTLLHSILWKHYKMRHFRSYT